jgi:predicted ester cyclase
MDVIEQNKNTVTEFIDALFTKGDLGAVDEYLAGEFVNHDPPMGVTAAFPDWHSEMDILVGEGDLVVEHFTASGTQQGAIFGVPPSGHTVTLPGINIWRVRAGRIVERWGRLDELGLLRQLGLVSLP